MASHEPTDITAEFYIDGEWRETYEGEDLGARIRGNEESIRITRGLADQQSAVSPSQAVFKLNNRDGLFIDDNPYSPLWGKFGLNTRCRIGVKHSDDHWDEYVRFPDFDDTDTDQNVTTTDKASLDITGDIDIRVEYTPYYTRGIEMVLAGKWLPGSNQCSWLLLHMPGGQIKIFTSPDGTSGSALSVVTTPALVAENATRVAVRVTLDVNDGGGNRVYRFYTADSISGSWTQQASLTTAGTTSIFSSSENLELGSASDGSGGAFTGVYTLRGKLHAFELYSGISGTLVADFKPQGKDLDATTWVDTCASPNTWVLNGDNIRLATDRIRITGELSSIPDEWDVSGRDKWVTVTLSGILKRYQDNSAPISSALYQNWRNYPGITGGWALEDASGSTRAASFLTVGQPGAIESCTFGSATGLNGASGALTLTSAPGVSKAIFTANTVTNTGETSLVFIFKLASLPAGTATFCTLNTAGGTVAAATVAIGTVSYTFSFYDKLGTLLDSGAAGFGETPLDQWIAMAVTMKQEGSDIRWETTWHKVGTNVFYTHNPGGDTFVGTVGQFKRATFNSNDAAWAGTQLSFVILASDEIEINTARFRDASNGYDGEAFGRRAIRLAEQEGVFFEWLGDPDDTEACGPQAADTLFNILVAGATADGGILDSPRDKFGYRYITRMYLGNRRGLTMAYGDSSLSAVPLPINDHRYAINDFTATRPSGSSSRYEANDDRRKSVRDPDDPDSPGIGRYERSGTYSVSTDDQLANIAQWVVSFGTWPERRLPQIAINLNRPQIYSDPLLLNQVIAQDLGDPFTLTVEANKPLPPNDLLMTELGYTEVISNKAWEKVSNTVPAGPYQVPVFSGLFESEDEPRLAESGNSKIHALAGTITTSSTSIKIRTPSAEPAWVDTASYSSEFDFDIGITGERMTLTGCTAASSDMSLHDGTFESGVPSSVATSCTFTQSSTFARTGTFSGLITVVGSPGSATIRIPSTAAVVRADPGDVITLTVWLRSTTAVTRRVTLDWYDGDGVFISKSDSDSALASGSFVSSAVTGTAPAGTKYVHYGWGLISSPAAGTVLYADDVTLTNATQNYQVLTVTRSVNTVSKTHSDGENVALWFPPYIGR